MKIIILNWRDIKNPRSGGAEILTHELAKRWVEKGHHVTQFSSSYKDGKREEVIDGVQIIREGHPDARFLFASVHFAAFVYYFKYWRGKVDVVIDEIHGLPFFTPLYVKERKVALICEVAGELWEKIYGKFFGTLGRLTEIFYLRVPYRNMHFITISNSTKKEITASGIPQEHVDIIPMGIRRPRLSKIPEKEKSPTLIFLGRISKAKGVEDAIRVIDQVSEEKKDAKLWIVGQGEDEYENYLTDLVKRMNLEQKVVFWGFVSEEKKFDLLARATILIAPSQKEGFGLTLPEAGVVGTPTIAYNVPGLQEIISHDKDGILVPKNVQAMTKAVLSLLENTKEYKRIQKGAEDLADKLSFDKSSEITLSIITHAN